MRRMIEVKMQMLMDGRLYDVNHYQILSALPHRQMLYVSRSLVAVVKYAHGQNVHHLISC